MPHLKPSLDAEYKHFQCFLGIWLTPKYFFPPKSPCLSSALLSKHHFTFARYSPTDVGLDLPLPVVTSLHTPHLCKYIQASMLTNSRVNLFCVHVGVPGDHGRFLFVFVVVCVFFSFFF